jgi:hypothetical protein
MESYLSIQISPVMSHPPKPTTIARSQNSKILTFEVDLKVNGLRLLDVSGVLNRYVRKPSTDSPRKTNNEIVII